MSAHIAILYVLNGVQGVLVMIVLLTYGRAMQRIEAVEGVLKGLPDAMRAHDDELADKIGRKVYDQMSRLMYQQAEQRAIGRRRTDGGVMAGGDEG